MRASVPTKPLQGFRDFTPEDWRIQKYIFDAWTKVCVRYGYKEYNGPVLENVEIYNKSGDDVGSQGKEIYSFEDRGGRFVALRPEMTPTVGRMIASYGKNYSKPIRWFSIAQFFRAEKPQRGRGREFFQLNADIFGSDSLYSDFEVVSLSIDILREFGATDDMFEVKINNRKFTDFYLDNFIKIKDPQKKSKLIKIIDAYPKKGDEWLKDTLKEFSSDKKLYEKVKDYLRLTVDDLKQFKSQSKGAEELINLFELTGSTGLTTFCKFDTSMARGFDYYTGVVFEVFDKDPKNNRAMFGGGRYDDLLDIFGEPKIPAVGFAPGDVTTRLFLESWGLLDQRANTDTHAVYAPILSIDLIPDLMDIVSKLRRRNITVQISVEPEGVSKALSYANKNGFGEVLIFGDDEASKAVYKVKNMADGSERTEKV